MMSKTERLLRIYERVELKSDVFDSPTRKEILRYIGAEDDEASRRRFTRDLVSIENEYGVRIKPDSTYRYSVVAGSTYIKRNMLSLLNAIRYRNLLKGFQENSDKFEEFVKTENPEGVGGEWVEMLFSLIVSQKEISLVYRAYWRPEPRTYTLKPYQLKEYGGRWYLIAWRDEVTDGTPRFQSFGLDRIKHVEETEKFFKRTKARELNNMFDQMMGIWGYEYEPIEIEVWFDNDAKNYIKSNIWHRSQSITEEDENGIVVRWKVTNNFEFKRRLLSWTGQFRVIKPNELREELLDLANNFVRLNS